MQRRITSDARRGKLAHDAAQAEQTRKQASEQAAAEWHGLCPEGGAAKIIADDGLTALQYGSGQGSEELRAQIHSFISLGYRPRQFTYQTTELARATDRHGLTFREVDQTSLDAGDARLAGDGIAQPGERAADVLRVECDEIDPRDTFFVNVDTVGQGTVHHTTADGYALVFRSDQPERVKYLALGWGYSTVMAFAVAVTAAGEAVPADYRLGITTDHVSRWFSDSTKPGQRYADYVAEDIKIRLGSAAPLPKEMTMEVKGRDLVAGIPKTVVVSSDEVREALDKGAKLLGLGYPGGAVIDALARSPELKPVPAPGGVRSLTSATTFTSARMPSSSSTSRTTTISSATHSGR